MKKLCCIVNPVAHCRRCKWRICETCLATISEFSNRMDIPESKRRESNGLIDFHMHEKGVVEEFCWEYDCRCSK